MIKMVELRKFIQARLKPAHARVYYTQAPKNAVYPYIVYNMPDSTDDGSLENFVLDVEGWDAPQNGDTTELETMMDAVDKQLHRQTDILSGTLSATYYRENRLAIQERDDPRIRRRRYTYQVRTYEGGR